MLKTIPVAAVLTLAFLFGGAAKTASSQEAEAAKAPASKTADTDRAEANAYHFDISINELESGKRINTRQYSMQVSTVEGRSGSLRIGTRIPVELKQGEIQYFDVGTKISARIQSDHRGSAGFWVEAEISSLAVPDQSQSRDSRPILRQLTMNGSTAWDIAVMGKPMVIDSVDDPDSNRAFQLEVTVTKLK